ncbi:restriction endonuclease subunit S [Salinicoccus roseus]|uniref:restriction endonuclease subunit S n=1 Tax=Salinicoccus roseus TaxID=45670 RepID=UPI000F4E4E38|nr:restriction endonuclease subunit S [Salinicoccus roseus]RPE52889.1 type I restriction enzyme S subunit [Salinicoccus roseus]GGA72549.1 hypothetical protein GCM10007176_15880 [Salinicoccus roseus]
MNMEPMPMIEWEKALDIQGGTQPPRSEFINHPQNGYIRLIQIRDFDSDKHKVYVPFTNKLKTCQKEDIFIARYGASTGRILTGLQGAYNVALAKIIKKDKKIDNKFLYYFLQSYIFQNYLKRVSSRSAQSGFNKNDLASVAVPKPSFLEQQKIASILSSVDEAIEKTQAIVKQTRKVRKGIIRELLNEGIDNTKFKDTPVGNIPISWSYKKLSEVTEIINGGTPSRSNNEYWENGNIPWATPTDITKQKSKYIKKTNSYINNQGLDNSSATLLPIGAVLMTSRATIGERSINTVPMATNQGFKSFICKNDELLNEFLYYLIEILKDRFKSLSSGSTFLEISKSEMESFLIQVPPIEEQKEICKRISSLDTKIQIEQQQIQKLSKIKNGLMQQLLTGKVRVPLNENEEVPQ